MIDLSDTPKVKLMVEGCVKGNRKSQKNFYQTFYGKCMSICMRYADNRDEAKDIFHDRFIKVFENLKDFKFTGSLEGWVKKIVTNTAIDSLRKKKALNIELEDNRNYDDIIDSYEETVEYEQINQMKVEIVMQLIQKLTPMYRTVFNLFVFEEYTHKEIAEELKVTVGTSKSNYSKAKKKLIKLIEEYNNGHKK